MKRRSNKGWFTPSEPWNSPSIGPIRLSGPITLTFIADLTKQFRERERGLQDKNAKRRCKAEGDYQIYREVALKLYKEKPHLRGASRHRIAQAVRAELGKTQSPPSLRTIERAFGPKNKV
jgi:hypothetical protein